eukprot:893816-Pleurochrysis_carterae.AAC.1
MTSATAGPLAVSAASPQEKPPPSVQAQYQQFSSHRHLQKMCKFAEMAATYTVAVATEQMHPPGLLL